MPVRVAVVGDAVTDVVAVLAGPPAADTDTAAAIRFTGGGQAANTAAWLAGHGVPVTLLASVGADEAGASRLAELRAAGVDCPLPPRPEAPTGTVIVLAEGGRRTMVTDRGASLLLDPDEVALALAAAGAGHLHLSGYPLLDDRSRPAGLRALAAARELGLTISVDAASAAPLREVGGPAFRSWVGGVDLLLANADEAAVLAADLAVDSADSGRSFQSDAGSAARSGRPPAEVGAQPARQAAVEGAPASGPRPGLAATGSGAVPGRAAADPAHGAMVAAADGAPEFGPRSGFAATGAGAVSARAAADPAHEAMVAAADAARQAQALAAELGAVVVVKLGAAGAVWAEPDGTVVTAPAVTAVVVDPTGAGDAFAAGLLATRLAGGDPEACLKAAAAAGARAVVAVGARP
ncbi:carbohydrate kinase family protein [Asanoa sp. NPDC049518]|uniref:carbohydrate kinase family protein n=1 Tax=unclassified Asanoa TaxID=2685164 RepID=UPI003415D55B